jgi:hypothetical protein
MLELRGPKRSSAVLKEVLFTKIGLRFLVIRREASLFGSQPVVSGEWNNIIEEMK